MRSASVVLFALALWPAPGFAQTALEAQDGIAPPTFLADRGPGVPTSMFGTYVLPGELLVYPFFEYYRDADAEYSPLDLGHGLDEDFRGDYEASEYLLFLGYGLTRDVAVELEAAFISAELEKSPLDPTALPREVVETGLGDVQVQVDWRWMRETGTRPAAFSYGEIVFPTQETGSLIGTTDWEFKVGTGLIRGFRWGTATVRAAMECDRSEGVLELGEVAVEYLKRLSPAWRIYMGVEGTQDEVELISEAQWHMSDRVFFKFNSAFGVTSKATDWGPETGVMFRF